MVTFRVNGRIAATVAVDAVPKVRIPVTAADVIADGTIGLTMASQGPAIGNLPARRGRGARCARSR